LGHFEEKDIRDGVLALHASLLVSDKSHIEKKEKERRKEVKKEI